MDGRLAWVLQESPCFFFAVGMWRSANDSVFGPANKVLLALYILHYSHRTWVFPIRMRGGKPTPFFVFLLALSFCLVNGFLQSRYLTAYASFPEGWETSPQFISGVAMFFAGMYINMDSDVSSLNCTQNPLPNQPRMVGLSVAPPLFGLSRSSL
jgi:3-oxo-5-alpha-steroid 4-dehydrogenase 1